MGKIAKRVNKINFTMLYGNYCYIIIENFPQTFSPCSIAEPARALPSSAEQGRAISNRDEPDRDRPSILCRYHLINRFQPVPVRFSCPDLVGPHPESALDAQL